VQGGLEIAGLSPLIIPVFVSHLGCSHRCVFCDQRQFSEPVAPEEIPAVVGKFLAGCRSPHERKRLIAFYGGSFTGIDRSLFERYLAQASLLVKNGTVHGIKASTRPDMVTEDVIARCREAGFVEMEIGAQSMDDAVLKASLRGHSASDTSKAARIVRGSGIRLGIQIMPGLPGESRESYKRTVEEVLRMRPDGVRIYPTVVLAGTPLERLYREGAYQPLELEEAVLRSLYGYVRFSEAGCTVLRMGLPPVDALNIAAGPYHPSFGFLVKARAYKVMGMRLMEKLGRDVEFVVHPNEVSELIGFKRENVDKMGFSYSSDDRLPREYLLARNTSERGCLQPKDIIEYIL